MENVLKTERICEVVKVHPKYVAKNIQEIVLVLLREKYEGKATEYGYIRRGSIKFASVSSAQVEYYTLHGYVNVDVVFTAQVFNPPKDSIIDTQIMDMNDFGYKASSFMDGESIIEIIIPKQLTLKHGVYLNPTIGDSVKVKIMDMRVDHMTKRLGAIACFSDLSQDTMAFGQHIEVQRSDQDQDQDPDDDELDVTIEVSDNDDGDDDGDIFNDHDTDGDNTDSGSDDDDDDDVVAGVSDTEDDVVVEDE